MLIGIRKVKGARQPVGWTHEDIDGLFGKTTPLIRKRDILTPKQLEAALYEAAFNGTLPVHIEYVDAVLNYKGYFSPCIDPKLAGFGYSHLTSGYHAVTFMQNDDIESEFPTTVFFEKYQQNDITLVDVSGDRPRIYQQSNSPEICTVLLESPSDGRQRPTELVPPTEVAYWDSVMKDVEYLLQGAEYAAERDEWAVFVAERKDEMQAPSTLPVDLVCRPPEATAREDIPVAATEEFRGRIRSSHDSRATYAQLKGEIAQTKEELAQRNIELSAVTAAHEDIVADYDTMRNTLQCTLQREATALQSLARERNINAQLSARNAHLCEQLRTLTGIVHHQPPL